MKSRVPLLPAAFLAFSFSLVAPALIAARTMTGADGHVVEALPHDKLREVLKKYNRLVEVK